MSNMFILINVIIAISLLSVSHVNIKDEETTTYTNSDGYKFFFMIIHFIAYLFIINKGLSKITTTNNYNILDKSKITTTNNCNILDLSKLNIEGIINCFKIKYLDNDDKSSNILLKSLFIFNVSTFNYINPLGFIFEFIIFYIILHCTTNDSWYKKIKLLIVSLFSTILDNINLKIISILLILYYIIQIGIASYNIIQESECDNPNNCNIIKAITTIINFVIVICLGIYLSTIDKSDYCLNILGIK